MEGRRRIQGSKDLRHCVEARWPGLGVARRLGEEEGGGSREEEGGKMEEGGGWR